MMQAVPTTYVDVRNNTIPTYQYSVTEYFKVRAPAALQLSPAAASGCVRGMGAPTESKTTCVCCAAAL